MRLSSLKFPMTTVPWEPGKIFQQVGTVTCRTLNQLQAPFPNFLWLFSPSLSPFLCCVIAPFPPLELWGKYFRVSSSMEKASPRSWGTVPTVNTLCSYFPKKSSKVFVLCIPAFKGCAKAPGLVLLRIPGDKQGILNQTSNSGYFLYVSF